MKAFKTLMLVKSLAAAAIATTSLVAPAISHASPDDGMICRSGYSGTVDGGRFKCSKARIISVALECTNLRIAGLDRIHHWVLSLDDADRFPQRADSHASRRGFSQMTHHFGALCMCLVRISLDKDRQARLSGASSSPCLTIGTLELANTATWIEQPIPRLQL